MVITKFDILLLITIFHVSHCERRIVGGEQVTSEKSYVVYLVKATVSDRTYDSWLCGGALVSKEFIITSAACVEDVHYMYAIAGYRKYVNDKSLEKDDCTNQMKKKIVYTCVPVSYEFDFDKIEKWAYIDIALVKVESPYDFDDPRFQLICSYVPSIIPINYDLKRQATNVDAMVLGWGHTEYWRQHGDLENYNQDYLRFGSTTLFDKNKCQQEYTDYLELTKIIQKYMICSMEPGHLNDHGVPYSMNQKQVRARCITEQEKSMGYEGVLCEVEITSEQPEQVLMNHLMHDGDETRKCMSLNEKSNNITNINVNGTDFVKGTENDNGTDIVNGTVIASETDVANGTDNDNGTYIVNGTDNYNGTDIVNGTDNDNGTDIVNGTDNDNGTDIVNGTDNDNGTDIVNGTDNDNGTDIVNGSDNDNGTDIVNGTDNDNGTDIVNGTDNDNGTDIVNGTDNDNGTDIVNGTDNDNGTDIVNGSDIMNGIDIINATNSFDRTDFIYKPGFGNISGYFNRTFTRRNGICQNDHGGPLVTWVGKREFLIGVASVFKITKENKCIGPFLYTSTVCNGAFIGCVLGDRRANVLRGKDMSISTRQALFCDSPPSVKGFDTIESYVSWKDHPAGPADNEKHMRGRLVPNVKRDRYATNVKEDSEEDVNPLNGINTQHKIFPNSRPKKDEKETNDRFSLRIGLPPGIRPPPRKGRPLRKRPLPRKSPPPKQEEPPIVGSPQEIEPTPIVGSPQEMQSPPINSQPLELAPPPITSTTQPSPEMEPLQIIRAPPIIRPPLKIGPSPIIRRPPEMRPSPIMRPQPIMGPPPKIRLPPQIEPPAFDEILNFKSDEVFVKKSFESKPIPKVNEPSSVVQPERESQIQIRPQSPLRG